MVSNEAKGFEDKTNEYIKILEDNYGMDIVNISLDEIISFFDVKNEKYDSDLFIDSNDFFQFESDEKSTQKSYIIKMSLLDLIRITSDDPEIRKKYSYEEDKIIMNSKLKFSLLYDNVRGFLGQTKYNKNILSTLNNEHNKFFMFNNGITIVAEDIDCEKKNSDKKYLFNIKNFQIVNGGQTIRAIYNFLEECKETEIKKLSEACILVRVFKVKKEDKTKNSIAEYTNSQNAISDIDLKSIDPLQIQIEEYFRELKILYSRKAGDLGGDNTEYTDRITMERMAQLLYSKMGYPDRASNQKQRLFQSYYRDIFKGENFSLQNCQNIYSLSKQIINVYNHTNYKYYDQKMFYIIYITSFTKKSIKVDWQPFFRQKPT
jgi:hypothetical protein